MFDQPSYPYTETFVREAIQNSLDARLDPTKPVLLNFSFHLEDIGRRHALLKDVMSYRERASLEIPDEWQEGKISWLIVEDFNSKGLSGSLDDRTSDFWNYWLNFGISNKEGIGRGGRGFGRVTFLIASRLRTVVGYTKRIQDGSTAVCGMTVLRAQQENGDLKSTDAYLAKHESKNIYELHSSPEFHRYVCDSLSFSGYAEEYPSGLGLAIFYPHKELDSDSILAAAIENFAPAIMDESLALRVNGRTLDAASIIEIARDVTDHIKDEAIKNNVSRFLSLVRQALRNPPSYKIELPNANANDLKSFRNKSEIVELQQKVVENHTVVMEICFPLYRGEKWTEVSMRAIVGMCLPGQRPIDRLFREGMGLPDVRARGSSELDLIMLVDEGQLAAYLNFCEGKAHLDLLESKEVLQTLKEHGFNGPQIVSAKRLVKRLPYEIRTLFTPDVSEPDSNVFDRFFSKPAVKHRRKKRGDRKDDDIEPIPPPNPAVFNVDTLEDGLRMYANPEFLDWPTNVTVTIAYADGTRRPSWSPFDFVLDELTIDYYNCDLSKNRNRLRLQNCRQDTTIEITGFDTNRELDTTIRVR